MTSCDVQNVTCDLFLLMLCINRRENHLIAATVCSKSCQVSSLAHDDVVVVGLHSVFIVKDQTERVRKKEHLAAEKNVDLRQSPRLLVKLPTRPQKITLRSARRMEATAVSSSHSWGNRCALSKRFPIMSLRERAKARCSPLCGARLLFFQLLYLTLFLPQKNGITLDRAFGSALLRAFLRLSSPPGSLTSTSSEPLIPFLFGSSPLLLKFLARPACPLFPSDSELVRQRGPAVTLFSSSVPKYPPSLSSVKRKTEEGDG